jgi:hypothetical protein
MNPVIDNPLSSGNATIASRKPASGERCWPTFVGIGSMRCGSTWLYEVLKCHPDIRLSDAKELDFFFMHQMLKHDLAWYEARFASSGGGAPKPVRGEISPLYARLKAWQVKRVAALLPGLRIVFTLRHPIERAWSQAVYEYGYRDGRDVRSIRPMEFLRQVERARNRLSSDYLRTIQIWSGAFGREALHIDFFDRLKNDPDRFVQGVLRHIKAPVPWNIPERFVKKKVFATDKLVEHGREIPEIVRWYLADQLIEPTKRLNDFLDGRVSHWVNELCAIRGKTRPGWRLLKELNRTVLSLPERSAYEGYHAVLDLRLWLRWRQLQRSYRAGTGSRDGGV